MQQILKTLIHNLIPFSFNLHLSILMNVQIKRYKKGDTFLEIGEVCNQVMYIHSGFLRAYVLDGENNKITCWFKWEQEFVTSVNSFSNQTPSEIGIEFLEDATVFTMDKDFIEECISKDIHIANFYRKKIENNFNRLESMLISQITRSATERYINLMEKEPQILQRAPLSHVASFLGITQSTLSRLRAKY